METLITTLLTMTLSFTLYGQQVIATAGAEYKNAGGTITFTVGEPVITILQASDNLITQGFHQNKIKVTVTAIHDPIFSSIRVFPNPAADKIIIQLENATLHGSTYLLYDFNGRQLHDGSIRGNEEEIELTSFVPGTYVLTILRDEKTMITYQIIKQ